MSSKKKSHGVLFTPYLQKGEDLIWVGSPEKNPYLSFHFDANARERFRSKLFWTLYLVALISFPVYIILFADLYSFEIYDFSVNFVKQLILLCFGLIVCFFIHHFIIIGKIYYAISSKRLFILRRHFWNSLDTDSLMLLPEQHLKLNKDKVANIEFEPIRVEKFEIVDRYSRRTELREFHRSHLEKLSQEDAETANELLTAVKNDMLDERARQLGLMD